MEENIYDTNKLIDAYKNKEKLNGYTTIFNVIEFPKALLLDMIVLYPTDDDFKLNGVLDVKTSFGDSLALKVSIMLPLWFTVMSLVISV